jgi:hypothetical protein
MIYSQLPAEKHYPDNVAHSTSDSEITDFHLSSEGPEGEPRQLQSLYAEGNPDNGDNHEQTAGGPEKGSDEAAQYQPEKISDKPHCFSFSPILSA